jgi:hypothetical protein
VLHGWGGGGVAPFYSRQRRLEKGGVSGGRGGGETGGATEWQWPRSERGQHRRRRYFYSVADERGPRGFLFFLNYPNRLKIGN